MEGSSVILSDEEALQTAESSYTETFEPVTQNPETRVNTSSVMVLGTSAVVIALYLAVVIGIATWSDSHGDTGIIADEADSSNAVENVAAGPQGSGQASLPPEPPASAADGQNDNPRSLFPVRTTKRNVQKIADDTSPPAAVDAADTTAVESAEERRKPRIPGRIRPTGPQSPMTPVPDDLATMPADDDRVVRKRYVSRGKRPSTSTRTTSDYDLEPSSAVEDVIVQQTAPEKEAFEPASSTGRFADATDWLTVKETAEAMPETAVSTAADETVPANAVTTAPARKARTHSHTTTEAMATTQPLRKRHHHHLWRSTMNEIVKPPPSTNHERSKSTGRVSTAATLKMHKINTAVAAKKNIATSRTTPMARTTPLFESKHRLEKTVTERTAKALSIRSGQKTKSKAWTLLTTVRTLKGHKIVDAKTHNSLTMNAKTVKAFSIAPKTANEQVP